MDVVTAKQNERLRLSKIVAGISTAEKVDASAALVRCLEGFVSFQQAETVLMYAPMKSEPDFTSLFIDHELDKTFCFPKVTKAGLELYVVKNLDQLITQPNSKLKEPDPARCDRASLSDIDAAIIPGLGFDPRLGLRLGRGGGFYDKMLANPDFSAVRIGVCFWLQLCTSLPHESHDIPMHAILTELGVSWTAARAS